MLWLKEYMHYHDISHILFFICIIIVYRDLQCICNDEPKLKVNHRVARLLALAHNSLFTSTQLIHNLQRNNFLIFSALCRSAF